MKLLTKEPTMAKIATFTPTVQHTNKYKQFKWLAGNRPVVAKHVDELAASFEANPNLIELRPILVNEKMEIVDGQHRLKAAEKVGIEVPYIVAPGLTVATAQLMNAMQKPWSIVDFAHSYAYSGNRHYQDFEKYMDEYGLNPTDTMMYITNRSKMGSFRTSQFKRGLFEMPEDRAGIDERLGILTSFADFKGIPYRQSRFSKAVQTILNVEGYDHERMMRNFALALPTIKPQADVREWLRELERVYNYNVKSDANTLRFF